MKKIVVIFFMLNFFHHNVNTSTLLIKLKKFGYIHTKNLPAIKMNKVLYFLIACLGVVACQNKAEKTNEEIIAQLASGKLERIENLPSKFVGARNIDVWLPQNYDASKQYAVLYMHDGQMLFDSTKTWNKQEWAVDETVANLLDKNKIRPVIVVGIWNVYETRHPDYFPQKPFESLPQTLQDSLINKVSRGGGANLFSTTVQSDNYLKFLVEELKPKIDSLYSTIPNQENTFIAGSSMGGLISMYAICEYPDVFGAAACISTHWPGVFTLADNPIPDAFASYLAENLPEPTNHRIYFDYGTATLDSLYEPCQLKVDSIMTEKGYSASNWVTKKFEGANHTENAWRSRLAIPLTFLLAKE